MPSSTKCSNLSMHNDVLFFFAKLTYSTGSHSFSPVMHPAVQMFLCTRPCTWGLGSLHFVEESERLWGVGLVGTLRRQVVGRNKVPKRNLQVKGNMNQNTKLRFPKVFFCLIPDQDIQFGILCFLACGKLLQEKVEPSPQAKASWFGVFVHVCRALARSVIFSLL